MSVAKPIGWLLVVCALLCTNLASAQGVAEQEARRLFERGIEASDEHRWADAEESFARSYALMKSAGTLLNLAIARHRLGDHLGAVATLDQMDALPVREEVRARASELRQTVLKCLARVSLLLKPENAQLEVDGVLHQSSGASRTVLLAPGDHAFRASAPGHETKTLELAATAGEEVQGQIDLTPVAPLLPNIAASTTPSITQVPAAKEPVAALPVANPPENREDRASRWVRSPWLWTAVGVVVAGSAATLMLLKSQDEARPDGGTTNLVFGKD